MKKQKDLGVPVAEPTVASPLQVLADYRSWLSRYTANANTPQAEGRGVEAESPVTTSGSDAPKPNPAS